MLLEKLCNADGVSGNEDAVRNLILEEIKPYADDIRIDSMGNIIALKKGTGKKVMLAAHMDEVGLIISGITDKGYLKFKTVGGIDTRVLISKKVRIGDKKIRGVIGMKAVHLQSAAEREQVPKVESLTIDIGAKSKEEAKKRVSIGDYAAFDTEFSDFGTDKIKAKALDDRIGCMLLIEALKKKCEADIYACFTVQEEIGCRGAAVCAYTVNPDIALVLEGTTCFDVYKSEEHTEVTTCGGGAVLTVMDGTMIADKRYREFLYKSAKEKNIPIQYKRMASGGTDAGIIHKTREGVKTAVLAVACRYLHSPALVASKKDILSAGNFVEMYLDNIGGIIDGIA